MPKDMYQMLKLIKINLSIKFKNFYHNLDILLIDDTFLVIKKNPRRIFYAYNALIDDKRQVVISCDSIQSKLTE